MLWKLLNSDETTSIIRKLHFVVRWPPVTEKNITGIYNHGERVKTFHQEIKLLLVMYVFYAFLKQPSPQMIFIMNIDKTTSISNNMCHAWSIIVKQNAIATGNYNHCQTF